MNLFAKVSITQRLFGVSFVLMAGLLALAVTAWIKLDAVQDLALAIEKARVPQLERIGDVELNVTRTSLQMRHGMLSRTPQELATTLADIGGRRKAIEDTLATYKAELYSDAGRAAYANIETLARGFWTAAEPTLALVQKGEREAAFAMLVDSTIPARNKLLAALSAEKERRGKELAAEVDILRGDARATLGALVVMSTGVAAGLIAFALHLGGLLRRRVAQAQKVSERVRDGDLSSVVQDESRDEFSPLLRAMSDMQGSLSRVVSQVRQGSDSVATASAQIAQGNGDLSQRTEQQASTLEQTAASMEELGSTVRQNADNARQANQLALSASSVAAKGGEVVSQVVDTMKGINDSSKKIADIISVIDGIAFQTNILALNAAVEAARAGEQGRGFAVVASEVRNLAQRSAEAAKEIKGLITASVERVEEGTHLVDQAGATMQEIVTSIRRVTDIMGEISSASVEQSSGVSQVGQAVTQMDQATQQNAALVEESAAAAESLRQQAQQLVQAVAVFKLSGLAAVQAGQPAYAVPAHKASPAAAVRTKARSRPAAASTAAPTPSASGAAGAATPAAVAGTEEWTSF